MHRLTILCVLFALAGLGVALGWSSAGSSPAAPPEAPDAATPATQIRGEAERRPAPSPGSAALPHTAASAPRGYAETVEHLVELGLEFHRLAEVDAGPDRLSPLDERLRHGVARLVHERRDSPERALADLVRLTPGPDRRAPTPLRIRRLVLLRIVQEGLAWRHARRTEARIQSSLDALTASCLDVLPTEAVLVEELGQRTLEGRPYLGVAHESAVLQLFEATANSPPRLQQVASALLVTLWQNMERAGARTATETASLALLFAHDASPARRAAAIEHLLRSSGDRYLPAALEAVQRAGDRALTEQFASVAAQVLQPESALQLLDTLAAQRREACLAAHLQLAHRAPRAVLRTYETHLADGTSPEFRLGLVRSAGMSPSEATVQLALTAYSHDPDPRIQRDAVLALASAAPAERLRPVLESILGDPDRAGQPAWLDTAAGALVNAEGPGSLELLARYGATLERDARLSPDYRDQLVRTLDARIPGRGERGR